MLDYAGLGMGSGFPYCRYLETEDGGQVGNALTLKVFRKHIKRLVNYAEAGDGEKIREELKRIVPEYRPEAGGRTADDRGRVMINARDEDAGMDV